jgi:predicted permease
MVKSVSSPKQTWTRLRSLWQRREVKREIDEELRLHLQMRTAENIAAGMPPQEAAREARRRFGNVQSIREECREVRCASFGEATWQDIRFGLRMLRKNPGFTTVAVLTLAIGIGANTTIFSVFKTLVFNPLPYPDPDRIVQVWAVPSAYELNDHFMVIGRDYLELRAQCRSLTAIGAYNSWGFVLAGDSPEVIRGVQCTASLGPMLGMRTALGRWFTEDEEKPDAQRVAVLNHALWERRFGADPKVIGQKIRLTDPYLGDEDFIVVGVLPAAVDLMDFPPGAAGDVYFPVWLSKTPGARTSTGIVYVLGRLGPGVTLRAASAELMALGARLAREDPAPNARFSFRLVPLKQQIVGDMNVALMLMQGAVMMVLLLACANVAGMLLARTARRRTEIAVRVALGAGRRHVLRLMLAESFAISLLAVALGLLLAIWGTKVLARLGPNELLVRGRFHLDGAVLVFAMGLAMLTTVLAGLPPTLAAVKTNVLGALKEGGPQQAGSRTRLRQFRWLIVSQVALSLMMINIALLLMVSYRKVAQDSRSFITDQVITGGINMFGHSAYNTVEARAGLRDRLIESLRAVPGVKAVGATDHLPFEEYREYPILADSEAYDPNTSYLRASISCVTTGYFAAAGVAILQGRMVTAAEASAEPQGILINRTLARHYWGEGDPIGKGLRHKGPKPQPLLTWQVVGVVEDVRQYAEKPARPEIYLFNPAVVDDERGFEIVVRADGDVHRLVPAIRQALAQLDPSLRLEGVRTMTEVFDDSIRVRRFQMLLIDVFMAVALLLTAVGIYGSMAYYVAARTREIGLRMALGATLGDIVGLVVSQVALWLAVGAAVGVGMALGAGVLLRSMFYQTSPLSPFCLAGSLGVVALAALVACWLPARRAATINPIEALRYE